MTTPKGFDAYELKKIGPLMAAVNDYNPVAEATEALRAEVTLWRDGECVGTITEFEGDGLRLIPGEVTR